ncbi:MAG TPA: VOC family protein [Opitutaceae bacterium]|nr:VOC family protein [Opitutaceae bacterium]
MAIKSKYVHTNLTARDWRSLARFYQDVFGCIPKLPERDLSGVWLDSLTALSGAHLTGIHLLLPGYESNGPTLEIFSYDHLVGRPDPVVNERGFGHLAFLVDDVPAALEAVRKAGGGAIGEVATTQVTGVGVLTVVYATDPEGNILELQNWS